MAILLPDGHPARWPLQAEGIAVGATEKLSGLSRGRRRPLRVLLLNLMPDKPVTERQLARLLAGTKHEVELCLAIPDGYRPKTADPGHIWAFYRPWSRLREQTFDGLLVTGAPVETLPFEAVTYWRELTRVFDWARANVPRSFYICWAAQAALNHFHGVPKRRLAEKRSGVFRHRVAVLGHPLFRGFGGHFLAPVSRHTEVRAEDLPAQGGPQVLAVSPDAGLCALQDRGGREIYMFNHLEYEADTLAREYRRDRERGDPVPLPSHYFPGDDPEKAPLATWSRYGRLLFRNWLDEIGQDVSRAAGRSRRPRPPMPGRGWRLTHAQQVLAADRP